MMSLWDALRMNMMISYQELVRTFLSYTATSPWPQNRAEITAAKIHREILCDQNHKQTTKTRNKIVTNITQNRRLAAKTTVCCFFTQQLCDHNHYKTHRAPYIHVI
ncbi:hypothetical protein PAG84_20620, partial [Klebsiella quasipneumoniae]